MSRTLFGTDGIRGRAGVSPVDADGAYRLGRVVAWELAGGAGTAFVGRDTRPSGVDLADAVLRGLRDGGCRAIDLGVVPTPAVAHFVASREARLGLAVSASHNPADENGFKLFGAHGEKLPVALEQRVAQRFQAPAEPPVGSGGVIASEPRAAEAYVDFAVSTVTPGLSFDGLRLVVDCAFGATCHTTPEALRALGAKVTTVCGEPLGEWINAGCGALYPAQVASQVGQLEGALGLAHDGDGDRLVMVDERGRALDGDVSLGLVAEELHLRGALNGGHVVGTIISNVGLEQWLTGQGLTFHRSEVGDRNVWELMRRHHADLGGEPSGHTILRRLSRTDDALLTALQVLSLVVTSGRPLSELAAAIPMMPKQTLDLRVRAKPELSGLPMVSQAVQDAQRILDGDGRLVLRYSGTESVARILVEGPDVDLLDEVVELVQAAFRAEGVAG